MDANARLQAIAYEMLRHAQTLRINQVQACRNRVSDKWPPHALKMCDEAWAKLNALEREAAEIQLLV
jgi:predicted lipoprotein with Yx(FWY)xxD motif